MSTADRDNKAADIKHQPSDFCRRFSLSEILSATHSFSDVMLIGRGGFGNVYKGFIDDGATLVAVKRLNPESKQGAGEFWTEVKTLYKLRHRNLINLIGYSEDGEEMILVYDCMTNGTLADHLYNNHRKGKGENIYHLTWKQRLDICIGAARGLDYLHEGTKESVIHRDMKTTNILLDENWVPKVSDFGLSKMGVASHTQTHLSTDVKGTFGYLDPQYFLTRRLTKKSDVYAFGVVLCEVLCGRPPVDFRVEEEQCSLALWVQQCMKKGIIAQIVDPSLSGQLSNNSLKVFAEVAHRCLHSHPKGRPTMSEVTRSLELALASGDNTSPPKGMITNTTSNIARILVEGFKLGRKKLKNFNLKYRPSRESNGDPFTRKAIQGFRRFSLAEIRSATKNFDKHLVVGDNSSITIYRGLVDSGHLQVAVTRRKEGTSSENSDIFNAEIRVQSQVQHIHIVSLIGYCIERNEQITVYDYMGNGDLHYLLYKSTHGPLPWVKRLEVSIGVARGLQYLHAGANHPIIHRNLKPSNILLDQNWVVKLASVEFPTVIPRDQQSTSFNPLVACTVGYMDPEYILRGGFSVKSDVYSFGVVLLELLCGRMPIIYSRNTNQVNLVQWFKINMEMDTLSEVIDPYLIDKISPECLKEYVKLAEICTRNVGVERPSMKNVLDTLQYALQLQEAWQDLKQPGADFSDASSVCQDLNQNLSQENSLSKGMRILVVGTASKDYTKNTSSANLDYSDYTSDNLAR